MMEVSRDCADSCFYQWEKCIRAQERTWPEPEANDSNLEYKGQQKQMHLIFYI